MENNPDFLKYIYTEDLFIIEEPKVQKIESAPAKMERQEDQQTPPSTIEESAPVRFLGKNEQGILILVKDRESELLNQTDLDFLMKVVESGLRYSKNDFALVNTAQFPLAQIMEEVPYHYILSFGVSLDAVSSDPEKYQVAEHQGYPVLFADPLRDISLDQDKKKLLWSSLKTMFKIS